MCLLALRHPLLSYHTPPVVNPNKIGARKMYGSRVAATRSDVNNSCVSGGAIVGFECALEPAHFPPTSSVLDGVLIPEKKGYEFNEDGNLAEVVLFPCEVFVFENKCNKKVDKATFMFPLYIPVGAAGGDEEGRITVRP